MEEGRKRQRFHPRQERRTLPPPETPQCSSENCELSPESPAGLAAVRGARGARRGREECGEGEGW